MKNKKYLPVWKDGLNYDEQHLTFWIANNMERVDERYSFLPVRMLGDLFCGRKSFFNGRFISEINFETNESIGLSSFHSYIMPLDYYVAQKAYDSAAKRFFDEHPESMEISFGKLNENGVYDVHFTMDYEKRVEIFHKMLREETDKIQIADEFINFSQSYDELRRELTYEVSGALDLSEEEIEEFFYALDCRDQSYSPRKNICVDKAKIFSHYYDIPQKIFNLGNQYVKYEQNTKEFADFFEAAKKRDIDSVRKFVSSGVDINCINNKGETAFGLMVGSIWDDTEACRIEVLQEMIRMGANPAIYGAGYDSDILSAECLG